MSDLDVTIKVGAYLSVTNAIGAALLALILGYGLPGFAKILLIINMNVFSLPILLTGEFVFPLWAWYVIILDWVGNLAVLIRHTD